jgi:hypothetical protein
MMVTLRLVAGGFDGDDRRLVWAEAAAGEMIIVASSTSVRRFKMLSSTTQFLIEPKPVAVASQVSDVDKIALLLE